MYQETFKPVFNRGNKKMLRTRNTTKHALLHRTPS